MCDPSVHSVCVQETTACNNHMYSAVCIVLHVILSYPLCMYCPLPFPYIIDVCSRQVRQELYIN